MWLEFPIYRTTKSCYLSLCDLNAPRSGQPGVIWVSVWLEFPIHKTTKSCYLSLCDLNAPHSGQPGVIWASVWRWPGRRRRPVWRWRGTGSPGCMHCCRYDQTASPATNMSKIIYRNYINISSTITQPLFMKDLSFKMIVLKNWNTIYKNLCFQNSLAKYNIPDCI